jgi:hypothetical protein
VNGDDITEIHLREDLRDNGNNKWNKTGMYRIISAI